MGWVNRVRAFAVVGLLTSVGCVPEAVDLQGRACPCAQGWSCVDDVCIEGEHDGGAATDSGIDPVDAGMPGDAGAEDALRTNGEARHGEAAECACQLVERQTGIDQRAEDHVT